MAISYQATISISICYYLCINPRQEWWEISVLNSIKLKYEKAKKDDQICS